MAIPAPLPRPPPSSPCSIPSLTVERHHDLQTRFDPPYVYHYENEEDLLEAVKAIQANPLTERFVPDDMKADVYLQRCAGLDFPGRKEVSRCLRTPFMAGWKSWSRATGKVSQGTEHRQDSHRKSLCQR